MLRSLAIRLAYRIKNTRAPDFFPPIVPHLTSHLNPRPTLFTPTELFLMITTSIFCQGVAAYSAAALFTSTTYSPIAYELEPDTAQVGTWICYTGCTSREVCAETV